MTSAHRYVIQTSHTAPLQENAAEQLELRTNSGGSALGAGSGVVV